MNEIECVFDHNFFIFFLFCRFYGRVISLYLRNLNRVKYLSITLSQLSSSCSSSSYHKNDKSSKKNRNKDFSDSSSFISNEQQQQNKMMKRKNQPQRKRNRLPPHLFDKVWLK